jgi:hypothetical protein
MSLSFQEPTLSPHIILTALKNRRLCKITQSVPESQAILALLAELAAEKGSEKRGPCLNAEREEMSEEQGLKGLVGFRIGLGSTMRSGLHTLDYQT